MVPGDTQPSQIGQIEPVNFLNPAGLQPLGDNLFAETAASGAPQAGTPGIDGLGEISQNMLETSNVNMVEELVNMIETQRAYEVNRSEEQTSELQSLMRISYAVFCLTITTA